MRIPNTNLALILEFVFLLFLLWLFYTRFKGAEYGRTTSKKARRMIEFAKITKKDVVYDLGSGFGGLVIKSARYAKKVTGIEFDSLRYLISKINIIIYGLKNTELIRGDFFSHDLSDADIIFLFLKQKTNQKLKSKLKKLKKGTRIISNTWTFENWKPVKKDDKLKVYLYVIGKSDKGK